MDEASGAEEGAEPSGARRGWLYAIAIGTSGIVALVVMALLQSGEPSGMRAMPGMGGMSGMSMAVPSQRESSPRSFEAVPGASKASLAPADARGDGVSTTMTASTASVPTVQPFPAYVPLPGEAEPTAKQLASRFVQTITTYPYGGGTAAHAGAAFSAVGLDPASTIVVQPLLSSNEAAAGEIVYPQLGGLTAGDASVMVVVRQHLQGLGSARTVTRTIDVRLARDGSTWVVRGVGSVGGEAVDASGSLSPTAVAVLSQPNLDLPDTARWDVAGGHTAEPVTALLQQLGQQYRLSVTTLSSGHPEQVFGTDRVSNHTRGRAVDVWAVNGVPIISYRDTPELLRPLLEAASAAGVSELGTPWQLELAGSFTDVVHQDHLHLGFKQG